jgi:hypothetical protein
MALSPAELAVVGTIGGAIIGALPAFVTSLINRRAEERRHFKDMVVKAAMENWKFVAENSASRAVLPMEHYIIHTAKMCEFAFSDEPITPETTKKCLAEIEAIMTVLVEHARTVRPPSK